MSRCKQGTSRLDFCIVLVTQSEEGVKYGVDTSGSWQGPAAGSRESDSEMSGRRLLSSGMLRSVSW